MIRLQHFEFNVEHIDKRVLFASETVRPFIRGSGGLNLPAQQDIRLNQLAHCFPNHHYVRFTDIGAVQLRLSKVIGEGTVQVYFVDGLGTNTLVLNWAISRGDHLISPDIPLRHESGYFFVRITTGLTSLEICDLAWVADQVAEPTDKLVIGITTFRREQYVLPNLEKLTRCPELGRLNLDIVVVDNGRTLSNNDLPPGVQLISQDNLGGTGGFMRSLHYAKRIEASRILFMDDDVEIYPELLYRALVFSTLTRDPIALGVMMMSASKPWMVWEQGGTPDYSWVYRIYPHNSGLNARKTKSLHKLNRVHPVAFTGWWGTVLPVRETPYVPNMFIKSDDILVGRMLDHQGIPSVTLPNAFLWHEDFDKKPFSWQFIYEIRNACYMRFLSKEKTHALPMLASMARLFVKYLMLGDHYRSSIIVWGLQEVSRLNDDYFLDARRLADLHQRAITHFPMQDVSNLLSNHRDVGRRRGLFDKLLVVASGFSYLPLLRRRNLADGKPFPVAMTDSALAGAGRFRNLLFFDPSTFKGYRSERRLSVLCQQSLMFLGASLRFLWRFRQLQKLKLNVPNGYWDALFTPDH
ncbi:hypothetical protein BGP77_16510 [Saccharospirillum sp. MSK14-1]|uniref:glycosyltransferase family 2 protein n=1 Tax=Saccharospirillum sp. MSK14-1 TaxID=1897632 RepID=UPI000D3618B7|nr:glycosyltransferase [Saccharospirillum sp. MSK14-1]PTY38057.1 hypothetical protein BGP77_16510 [Saccharospirillum sp. MSK14-1]